MEEGAFKLALERQIGLFGPRCGRKVFQAEGTAYGKPEGCRRVCWVPTVR